MINDYHDFRIKGGPFVEFMDINVLYNRFVKARRMADQKAKEEKEKREKIEKAKKEGRWDNYRNKIIGEDTEYSNNTTNSKTKNFGHQNCQKPLKTQKSDTEMISKENTRYDMMNNEVDNYFTTKKEDTQQNKQNRNNRITNKDTSASSKKVINEEGSSLESSFDNIKTKQEKYIRDLPVPFPQQHLKTDPFYKSDDVFLMNQFSGMVKTKSPTSSSLSLMKKTREVIEKNHLFKIKNYFLKNRMVFDEEK